MADASKTSFLDSILRITNSAKAKWIAACIATGYPFISSEIAKLPEYQRGPILGVCIICASALVGLVAWGWTQEDVADKSSPTPPVAINTGDNSTINQPQTPQPVQPAQTPVATPLAVATLKLPPRTNNAK